MFWTILAIFAIILVLYRILSNIWSVSNLSQKHVFITGCDTGFGHLLAIKLVQNGIPTFAGCLTEKGETELRKATALAPGKLWTVPLDVTKQESVDAAVASVKKQLGPNKGLWGLVNNAGVLGQPGPDDWLTVDMYQKALDVNCLGLIRVTHAFKQLIKAEKGRIVNITSIFGRVSAPGFGPYCVSKYAAEAYCDVLRVEMTCFNVSVHILEPGLFVTNITNSKGIVAGWQDLWQRQPQHVKEEYGDEYLTKCTKVVADTFDAIFGDASQVVDAYYHALTSRLPKLRYVVGIDAWLVYLPLSMLPTFVYDFFIYLNMIVRQVPIPKACQ